MVKNDLDDMIIAISEIKIPKQNRYLMVYSTSIQMIEMILKNGGVEVERHKIDKKTDYITYKL